MKKIAEPAIQLLFLVLSIFAAVLPSSVYINHEAWSDLFLTNIINGALAGLYLLARLILRNRNSLEDLQRAMLLFVIYSCLPVCVLIINPVTRFLSILCFTGAFVIFIFKNIQAQDFKDSPKLKSRGRIIFSILLLLFGAGFLFRGVNVIYQYMNGLSGITGMLVSVSDIIISLIWIAVGISVIRNKIFGMSNVLPCFIQASLLFVGLIVFLVFNPLIINTPVDIEAVIVIIAMSLFFFIPTIILVKKK